MLLQDFLGMSRLMRIESAFIVLHFERYKSLSRFRNFPNQGFYEPIQIDFVH